MNQENQTPKTCGQSEDCQFRTTIGGQALIEGILMRGPEKQAIVVRNQAGELEIKEQKLKLIKDRFPILGVPFIRGVVNFLASLVEGVKALMWSAEFYPEEEEAQPSKFETWLEKHFGSETLMKWIIGISVVAGVAFAIALFIILPTLVTSGTLYVFPDAPMWLRNLLEGVVKLVIFFVYLFLCSRLKDIQRTFRYHGAEHKTIFCYERGLELTVENARQMPRHHPRCGTSFLFVVIVIAVLASCVVFALPAVRDVATNPIVRILLHLVLLPVVVAVTYEINRFIGRHDNPVTRFLSAPGLWMQNFTTFEPDDSMLEVAIRALKLVLPEKEGAAAGKTAEELYRDISLYTNEDVAQRAQALLERRLTGEPIAYLVGEWSFCGLPFYVSSAALIPRIDTEMLAQLAMNRLKEYPGNTRILDLCAGTGCVGLTAAALLKTTRAVLVDLSDGALELCKRNIRRHKLTGRAVYLKGDALQAPSHALGQFDVLVCNPPYIPTGDLASLDPSVKDFEPLLALDGGEDGLDFYRGITELWKPALKPGGHLLYEVGIGQAEKVAWLLVKAGYENIRITRDTGGIDRVVEGQRPKEREIPDVLHETMEEEE